MTTLISEFEPVIKSIYNQMVNSYHRFCDHGLDFNEIYQEIIDENQYRIDEVVKTKEYFSKDEENIVTNVILHFNKDDDNLCDDLSYYELSQLYFISRIGEINDSMLRVNE